MHQLNLHCHQQDHLVEMEQKGPMYVARSEGHETLLQGSLQGDTLHFEVDGHRARGTLARTYDGFTLYLAEGACHFRALQADTGEATAGDKDAGLLAPMNGTVVSLLVEPGANVRAGTPLLIMEAMKMQTPVVSEVSGTVASISAKIGQAMQPGDKILKVDPAE